MKNNLKYGRSLIRAFSMVVGLMAGSVSQVHAENSNPNIIPPNSKVYGMTYGEWSARWWQWALSLPADQNPFFDTRTDSDPPGTGGCKNGANGQLGPVWFLTGVISTSGIAERYCTVPAGKALFFPIINVECSTLEAPPYYGSNEEELRACAESFKIGDVSAKIDGVPVQNLEHYLVESPLFTFTLPLNNVLGLEPGTGQSVSNGYYLMLPPLSVGKHNIKFEGTYIEPPPPFTLRITYHLTVAPPVKP